MRMSYTFNTIVFKNMKKKEEVLFDIYACGNKFSNNLICKKKNHVYKFMIYKFVHALYNC